MQASNMYDKGKQLHEYWKFIKIKWMWKLSHAWSDYVMVDVLVCVCVCVSPQLEN